MSGAFQPLFEGHVASDDGFNLDEQIDTAFEALEVAAGEWSVTIDTAAPASREALEEMRDRDLGCFRAVVATLTRLRNRRDDIAAPDLRRAAEQAIAVEATR